jgi:hypothetical protein
MDRSASKAHRGLTTVLLAASLACAGAAVTAWGETGGEASAPPAQVRRPAVVLTPRYTRGEYHGAIIPWRAVRVERVTDLRAGDATLVGATEVGGFKFGRVPLNLSVPVAEFTQKSFDVLLTADSAGAAPVRVALGIERFELDCQHSWTGPRDATFRARMAVTVITDSGETPSGWLEADEEVHGSTSKGRQERLMYQGMVGMAQGFERLSLSRSTAGAPAAPGASQAGARQTVTSKYQDPWTLSTTQWYGVHFVHYGLTGSQMKDSYGQIQGIMGSGGSWLRKGRAGIGGEVGYLTGRCDAKVLDPTWTVRKRELSQWTIPVSVTGYFRLLSPGRATPVTPYIGAGIGAFAGTDNLEIDATSDAEDLAGAHRALRASWEGHALAGAEIRIVEGLHVMLEAQWTQAGKASTASAVDDKNADEVAFWNTLHSILERPDNNFTGWRIAAGFRWTD